MVARGDLRKGPCTGHVNVIGGVQRSDMRGMQKENENAMKDEQSTQQLSHKMLTIIYTECIT